MSASPRPSEAPIRSTAFAQRRPLPALGLPRAREDRRAGALLSVALHVLIVFLLVTPFALHHEIVERPQGAGGLGPAGGGGGGSRGTGGAPQSERLQFIRVAPAPAPEQTPPPPEQQVVPPTPVPPPTPVKVVEAPKLATKLNVPTPAAVPMVAATPGAGGGSGSDGTAGSGPGSGGGVGTGIGTGRGSGLGPGTGGGTQENYPPSLQEMPIPPMPVPGKVRGSHVVAEFDVDSTGRVLAYDFSPTKDGDYNKKLDEVFRHYKFRPGTTPQGKPLRMKVQVVMDLP